MPTNIDANGDGKTPQQSPSPSLPPPVERNENSEGDNGQRDGPRIANDENKPPHWTRHVEAVCAIILVLITGTYTYYASRQACAAVTAANAAKSAADTAYASLKLTRDAFNASQAAVLQPNVSIRDVGKGPFIQIDIVNRGSIAATRVNGEITVTHHAPLRLTNVTVTNHSASPEYPSGVVTRTIGLTAPVDMKVLAKQRIRVSGELNYWNGIDQVTSRFCYGLTVSPYTSAQEWQDCENQETLQQTLR
jgi:hypothetical protein